MTSTPDPTDAEATRLRAAHELLDERPSSSVRAAVLRAAADAAGGDRAARAVPAARARAVKRWFEWRPMAAAGATLVAVLAVGVALHVEREAPVEPLPAASMPPPRSAAPVGPSRSPDAEPTPFPPATAPATPPSRAAAAGSPAIAPATTGPSSVAPAAKSKALAPTAPSAVTAPSPSPPMAPQRDQIEEAKPAVAPETPVAPRARIQAPAMGTRAPQAAQPAIGSSARELAPSEAGAARLKPNAPSNAQSAAPSMNPDDWLRRIVELRRAGRDSEADEELTRFRAAFPDLNVPADALK
jgi:hypothetical protein